MALTAQGRRRTPKSESERRLVPTTSLVSNPRNDRRHTPAQIGMLKASIEKFGQPRPLLARAENRMLIAGHGVLQAMLELGRPEIDALLWDCDQRTADQFLLADNRLAELSEVDLDRRRSLLDGLDEEDFPALGFLSADVEQLFGRDREIEVAEVEVGEVRDEFWISVRGPLAQQAPVLQKLTELLAEFRGVVDVELGTIAVE